MKPLLCNTQVVQNILAGRQTQDRRPIKINSEIEAVYQQLGNGKFYTQQRGGREIKPKYQVGDVLYVRETFCIGAICETEEPDGYPGRLYVDQCLGDDSVVYKEYVVSHGISTEEVVWKPSIHMPKKYARIFLKVTTVRVERIQDISWDDCKAEGVSWVTKPGEGKTFKSEFKRLWDSLYPGSWKRNDYVWVTEFELCEKPTK